MDQSHNIIGGPEHSTLANDAFRSREFDFMLANPPYGKSWKGDLERMGGKKDLRDPRFVIQHGDDVEYSQIGYEISFACHFYEPPRLRTLAEISADILALEEETEGLLDEIVGGGA